MTLCEVFCVIILVCFRVLLYEGLDLCLKV